MPSRKPPGRRFNDRPTTPYEIAYARHSVATDEGRHSDAVEYLLEALIEQADEWAEAAGVPPPKCALTDIDGLEAGAQQLGRRFARWESARREGIDPDNGQRLLDAFGAYLAVANYRKSVRDVERYPAMTNKEAIERTTIASVWLGQVSQTVTLYRFGYAEDLAALARFEAVRKSGGQARGKQLADKALEWKARALPVAQRLDTTARPLSRSALATKIILHFNWNSPSQAVVEEWLRTEAESPSGPLRSRARKQQDS
jgi:hypothetical protein